MLVEVRDAITAQLGNLQLFAQVDVWQGELDDLLAKAKKLPSAFVALAEGRFSPPQTIPPQSSAVRGRQSWDVILFFDSLRSAGQSTAQGYELIDAVLAKASESGLAGLKTPGGLLWPEDLELLASTSGKTAYRLGFTVEK